MIVLTAITTATTTITITITVITAILTTTITCRIIIIIIITTIRGSHVPGVFVGWCRVFVGPGTCFMFRFWRQEF